MGDGLRPLVGEAGADLAIGRILTSDAKVGKSRETVLLGCTENFGKGNELGGGLIQ